MRVGFRTIANGYVVYEIKKDGKLYFWSIFTSWIRSFHDSFEELHHAYKYGPGQVLITSCCGGNGGSKWNQQANQWQCTDCGTNQSTDPNYLGNKSFPIPKPETNLLPYKWRPLEKIPVKCECGSSIVGSDRHSSWCPLYRSA